MKILVLLFIYDFYQKRQIFLSLYSPNKSQQQLTESNMGNIQDVPEYQRVPIFGTTKSRTPKRITRYNNSPYHRQAAKSALSRSYHDERRHAINSVVKFNPPYCNAQRVPLASPYGGAKTSKNANFGFSRNLSFEKDVWESSRDQRQFVNDCRTEQKFQKLTSPTTSGHLQKRNLSASFVTSVKQMHSPAFPEKSKQTKQNSTPCRNCQNSFMAEDSMTEMKTERKSYNRNRTNPSMRNNQTQMIKQQVLQQLDNLNSIQYSLDSQDPAAKAYMENRSKCQEIICKVRNFNDFLNQVKKKLKSDIENTSMSENQSYMEPDSCRSVVMSIKLENEKIQLEKYRKLVNRELSKQHSIDSISIQTGKNNMQKLIRINYQSNSHKNDSKKKQEPTKKIKIDVQPKKFEDNAKNFEEKKNPTRKEVIVRNKQLGNSNVNVEGIGKTKNSSIKSKYEEVSRKMEELGRIILDEGTNLEKRMGKINNLMGHLEGVNQSQKKNCQLLATYLCESDQGNE